MLKLFRLPAPVTSGPGCIEGPLFLRGMRVVRAAKAIECVKAESQGKRGRSKFTPALRSFDHQPIIPKTRFLATSRNAKPPARSASKVSCFKTRDNQWD